MLASPSHPCGEVNSLAFDGTQHEQLARQPVAPVIEDSQPNLLIFRRRVVDEKGRLHAVLCHPEAIGLTNASPRSFRARPVSRGRHDQSQSRGCKARSKQRPGTPATSSYSCKYSHVITPIDVARQAHQRVYPGTLAIVTLPAVSWLYSFPMISL